MAKYSAAFQPTDGEDKSLDTKLITPVRGYYDDKVDGGEKKRLLVLPVTIFEELLGKYTREQGIAVLKKYNTLEIFFKDRRNKRNVGPVVLNGIKTLCVKIWANALVEAVGE